MNMDSKGIQPRVGMQFVFVTSRIRRRISKVMKHGAIVCEGREECCGDIVCTCTSRCMWDAGGRYEIEWIPPTDAERVMFQYLAKNALDFGVPFDDIGAEFCHREGVDFEDFARIAESLAMDGL